MTVTWLLDVHRTDAAATPPKVTLTPLLKPSPVMVTAVPPLIEPLDGVIAATVGVSLRRRASLLVSVVSSPGRAVQAAMQPTVIHDPRMTLIPLRAMRASFRPTRDASQAV